MLSKSDQKHIAEGYAAGLEQGRLEARLTEELRAYLRLLEQQFGPFPDERGTFASSATSAQRDLQVARLLGATRPEDAFLKAGADFLALREQRREPEDPVAHASLKSLDRREGERFARELADDLNMAEADTLGRLLERRFGPLSMVDKFTFWLATSKEISLWLDRVLDATSVAEVFRKSEGEAEARILLRLLRKRFGPLPRELDERVHTAPVAQLDRWLDRVVEANSLEEVLRP